MFNTIYEYLLDINCIKKSNIFFSFKKKYINLRFQRKFKYKIGDLANENTFWDKTVFTGWMFGVKQT